MLSNSPYSKNSMYYISEFEAWKKFYNDHFDDLNPNCTNFGFVEFANSLKIPHELQQQSALNTCHIYLFTILLFKNKTSTNFYTCLGIIISLLLLPSFFLLFLRQRILNPKIIHFQKFCEILAHNSIKSKIFKLLPFYTLL